MTASSCACSIKVYIIIWSISQNLTPEMHDVPQQESHSDVLSVCKPRRYSIVLMIPESRDAFCTKMYIMPVQKLLL